MIIFPAIDIRKGRCVRLEQGRFDKEQIFSNNPVEMALAWESKGAKILHVVDLDGARYGASENRYIIEKMIQSVNIPIQVGGGFRTLKSIDDMLQLGARKVIIGTAAVLEENFINEAIKRFGSQVLVSLDAENGFIAIEGWTKIINQRALDIAQELEEKGATSLIYTDIAKDGMLGGPNYRELKLLKEKTHLNIIASGGISSLAHIEKLQALNIYGAIIGKALYTGHISLSEIQEVGI